MFSDRCSSMQVNLSTSGILLSHLGRKSVHRIIYWSYFHAIYFSRGANSKNLGDPGFTLLKPPLFLNSPTFEISFNESLPQSYSSESFEPERLLFNGVAESFYFE